MAGPRKIRKLGQTEDSSDSDEIVEEEEYQDDGNMETIDVNFDVKQPEETDFHGIKSLLHQLFLKAHIDISDLANLLIEQKKITGVTKQAIDAEDEMEMDDDDLNVSFGVFSVVNLTKKMDKECVKQLHSFLLSQCKQACDDEKFQTLRRILEDKKKDVGLLISERMLNIPPNIAVPLYNSLKYDMAKMNAKGQEFNFEYFIVISKIVVFKQGPNEVNVVYTNAEEEFMDEVATFSFDFSVASDSDSGLAGNWEDDDMVGKRKRRVFLMDVPQFGEFQNKLNAEFSTEQQ